MLAEKPAADMSIEDFFSLAKNQGFEVKKLPFAARWVASRPGFADTQVFVLDGNVCLLWSGVHPVQISTEHWFKKV